MNNYVHMDYFTQMHPTDPRAAAQAERTTWQALEGLHADGVIRALGICNYGVQALERLWTHSAASVKPSVLQCKFDPMHPGYQRLGPAEHEQADVVAWAQAKGLLVVGYSTLSGWPFLLRAVEDPHVATIASRVGCSPAAVLLRHAMQRGVCVIPSSANAERLADNRTALSISLDERDMRLLDGLAHLAQPVEGTPRWVEDVYSARR